MPSARVTMAEIEGATDTDFKRPEVGEGDRP